jgi:ABC-2 type transport system ATP-binding protein
VEEGECVAILGPNGAGKTTTVEILEGHRHRSFGEVSVLGFDPEKGGRDYRERIGIVLQAAGFDAELSVHETVRLWAEYYPRPLAVDDVIERVGLSEKRESRVKTLSGGQHRRLDLALGLVGDPDLIFLDEPTTGFDPSARRKAWDLVAALRGSGKTILLTTHYMDEAQHLADRVVVLASGVIVAEGDPASLGGRERSGAILRFRLPPGTQVADLPVPAEVEAGFARIQTTTVTSDVHSLSSWAVSRGIELDGLTISRPSLEDVYLELTGSSEEQADG